MNVHISEYTQGNRFNHDPLRNRKLLLHRKQITKLADDTSGKGITLVPLKVYLKNGFAKVLLGVAQGKHNYDKRETIKRRDQEREIRRTLKIIVKKYQYPYYRMLILFGILNSNKISQK